MTNPVPLLIPAGLSIVWDCTGSNLPAVERIRPANVIMAGYGTGTSGVAWSNEQRASFPDAIVIDQSPQASIWDASADVDDYERGAVTLAELPQRARARIESFKMGSRVGQRMPLVYVSENNVHDVANSLVSGGVTSGVGLWIADWSLGEATAIADVLNASGPFPIHGFQFANAGLYDISVFSTAWLNTRSTHPVAPSPFPLNQSGLIVSFTTGEYRRATSTDHGATWR